MSPSRRRADADATAQAVLRRRSPLWWAAFGRIFEDTLRRGANAVRVAALPDPAVLAAPRLVIWCNHPSWWDPIVMVTVARRLLPGRRIFSPMEAAQASRYGFMPRIGVFGVEPGPRGAADFLAIARAVLDAGDVLVIAAQGRFADVRERPVRLAPGLAHLAGAEPDAVFLPLAVEYAFWLERRFEVLLRFGAPLAGEALARERPTARAAALEAALEATLDALAADSIARDPARFDLLWRGAGGVHPVFDAARAARARVAGRSFSPAHGAPARS